MAVPRQSEWMYCMIVVTDHTGGKGARAQFKKAKIVNFGRAVSPMSSTFFASLFYWFISQKYVVEIDPISLSFHSKSLHLLCPSPKLPNSQAILNVSSLCQGEWQSEQSEQSSVGPFSFFLGSFQINPSVWVCVCAETDFSISESTSSFGVSAVRAD